MTAQVELTEAQSDALTAIALRTGKSRETLLREAVSQFLVGTLLVGTRQNDCVPLLKQARGIWRNRDDLPDFSRLRSEWDRL